MPGARALLILVWSFVGLLVVLGACLVIDSTGPIRWTHGTVISTRFQEGVTLSNEVKVGDIDVPMKTEVPGAWIVQIDSPVLGRQEVACDRNFPSGQWVYVGYQVGRLSHTPEIVRLQPDPPGVVSP